VSGPAFRERRILTPEHVEVRLVPAGLGSRALAAGIDLGLVLAASAFVGTMLVAAMPLGGLGLAAAITAAFLIKWGWHVYFETRHDGRTPGKRLLGLRVVDGRGLPIGLAQSFVRTVVRVLDGMPLLYGLGGLVCQVERHRRRLGDLVADTLVIREGRTFTPAASLARAPEYNSLRVPRVLRLIRRRVSLEEREFLLTLVLRADEMENRARFDLMEDVARHYRARLAIDAPHLSGESLVRGLTAVLFAESPGRRAA
jgi:uncharacterized RDD family membrane protein YckC